MLGWSPLQLENAPGRQGVLVSIWGEAQTDYVLWWHYSWVQDLVLQSLSQPSVVLLMLSWESSREEFSRAIPPPAHLYRLTFSDPSQPCVNLHVNIRGDQCLPTLWSQPGSSRYWKKNTLRGWTLWTRPVFGSLRKRSNYWSILL